MIDIYPKGNPLEFPYYMGLEKGDKVRVITHPEATIKVGDKICAGYNAQYDDYAMLTPREVTAVIEERPAKGNFKGRGFQPTYQLLQCQ